MSDSQESQATIQPSEFTPLQTEQRRSAQQKKPQRIMIWVSLAVFIAAMAFLFSARSLQIVVEAEAPADIDIDGLALPFGDRYLLQSGDYHLTVTAEGYEPLSMDTTVDERDSQILEITLQALPGLISISTVPPGADVRIDGESVGRTPITDVPVGSGERALEVVEERHQAVRQTLAVTGREVRQQLHIELVPAWAEVSFSSVPEGARVLVDGEERGTTPTTLELLEGERSVELYLPSYSAWTQALMIVAGEPRVLPTVELEPAEGVLALESQPSGANVTINGEFLGRTPINLELEPGVEHRLNLSKPGFQRFRDTLTVSAAGNSTKRVALVPQLGEISFRVSPEDAQLYVNGQLRGAGDQTLSLPTVEQTFEARLDGYATVKRRITPRVGLPQRVDITLLTQEAARRAAAPDEIITSLGQTLLLFAPESSGQASFTMGASRREPGRRTNEVLREARLERMFYLQTHEVTNAQFRQFQGAHNSGQIQGKTLNRDHQPAVQVSWQQAASFCNWLSSKEGLTPFYAEKDGIITGFNPKSKGYRLPTEAEWAWAARVAGDAWLKFPWGDDFPPRITSENYADDASAFLTGRVLNGYSDGYIVSAPTGSFGANSNGLYDMGGNVAEWVNDIYTVPPDNTNLKIDPLGGQQGDNYVIRGASWTQARIHQLRLSHRDYGQAGRNDVGFRIARYAE